MELQLEELEASAAEDEATIAPINDHPASHLDQLLPWNWKIVAMPVAV